MRNYLLIAGCCAVRANRNDPELTTKLIQGAAETRPFATEHELLACVPDAK